MKIRLLSAFLVVSLTTYAQTDPAPQIGALRITWPLNRSTFQRNTTDQATFNIAGQHIGGDLYPGFLKVRKLQYKIVKLDTKTGADVSEITNGYEDFNNSNINNDIGSKDLRTFLKLMTIPKGSYRLQVRIRKGLLSGFKTIQRQDILFGVGDVYLVAGQSNASGYFDETYDSGIKQNAENYTPHHAVSVIDRKEMENSSNSIKIEGLPINLVVNTTTSIQKGFSKLEKTSNGDYSYIYPRGIGSWCWGPLASKLIENSTDVPISFFNAASPNSEIKSWADKFYRDDDGNFSFPPPWDTVPCSNLPCPNNTTYWVYKQFRSSLQMYGHILGLKSVLWHQGEADAQQNKSNYGYYTNRMNELVTQSRTDIGSNLSWLSSEVSYYALNGIPQNYHAESNPTVLNNAQRSVWNASDKKYQGIFTDDLGEDTRNSVLKIHFTGETLKTVGDRWFAKNPSQTTPTEGKTLLNLVVSVVGNSYRLTAPSGYAKYFWVENENGIYSPLNSDLTQNYYDTPLTQSGSPKFITCYAGESTGEVVGNATDGWNVKLRATQPFIIPGYENAPASIVSSKNLLAYNSTGGKNSFVLSSTNINWEALETTPWLSFQADEDLNGGEGNYPITVSVQPNTSLSSRVAYLTIQQEGGGISESVEVYQEGISDCNTALNLTSPINDFTSSTTKKTASTIQATNKLQANGTRIDYKAGQSITLNPGFKVDNGVVFYAQIEGCLADTPWQSSTIGSISGSTSMNNGTLTIDGTGNVVGSTDNVQFYNTTFSGDVTVIARVVNITAIDGMRGGIMLRSNANQNAKMYELILDGNANAGKLKRRNVGDNATFVGYAAMPTSNTWLKMTKTGNTILCFVSLDGNSWNEIVGWDDRADNDLGVSFLVGFLGYNSGNAQYCTVTFDNMSVNGVPVN
jgi:Carbohydrate esterase, sialic acid-specific acetylesterase/Viral BACON domain